MRKAEREKLSALAEAWEKTAEQRRQLTKADPGADTLDFCAAALAKQLRELEHEARMLTVSEYATEHGLLAATVRRWCVRGMITAEKRADGDWVIPADARRLSARERRQLQQAG